MSKPRWVPTTLRGRLTWAFALTATVSAALLSFGVATSVSAYRNRAFETRARELVNDEMRAVAAGARPLKLVELLSDRGSLGGPDVVVVIGDEMASSTAGVGVGNVPARVRTAVANGQTGRVEAIAEIRSQSTLVIGTFDPPTGGEFYFFFSREILLDGIRSLVVFLVVGTAAIALVSAGVGAVLAARTLRPVAVAADAARAVAEGLLDTRLPDRAPDEFGAWSDAFNEMVTSLQQNMSKLEEARDRERRFSVDIAHELRTPIGTVLTAASHLSQQRAKDAGTPDEGVDIILAAARRLDRLTSELLELHRLESGQVALYPEEVDVLAAAHAAVRAHAWDQRVTVTGESTVTVSDRRLLDRVIVNLVGNGLKHGGSDVALHVTREPGVVRMDVRDNGPGIPPGEIDRIFERHYNGKSEPRPSSFGSGLGLSIVREAVSALGGYVSVQSSPGRGTTFTVHLVALSSPGSGNGGERLRLPGDPRRSPVRAVDPG